MKFENVETPVQQIPLSQIVEVEGFNARYTNDNPKVQEIADSILANGQDTPMVVEYDSEASNFRVIAGHLRLLAFKNIAQRTKSDPNVNVIVREFKNDLERLETMGRENIERENFNAADLAKFAKQLKAEGLSGKEIALRIHKSPSTVTQLLKVNDLGDGVLSRVSKGEITFTQALELASVAPADREKVLETMEETAERKGDKKTTAKDVKKAAQKSGAKEAEKSAAGRKAEPKESRLSISAVAKVHEVIAANGPKGADSDKYFTTAEVKFAEMVLRLINDEYDDEVAYWSDIRRLLLNGHTEDQVTEAKDAHKAYTAEVVRKEKEAAKAKASKKAA